MLRLVHLRFYLDPATGVPHIWNHEVDEAEVEEVLRRAGETEGKAPMKRNRFPAGWDEARVRRVLEHYEGQTEDEAVAEEEAAFQLAGQTVMVVPNRLVPEITRLIERGRSPRQAGSYRPNKALQPTAHTPRRG